MDLSAANSRRLSGVDATDPPRGLFVAGNEGSARIGPLLALPGVLTELGIAPERAFKRADVSLRLFSDPESLVPYGDLARLFAVCAASTGCGHLGLLVGARCTLGNFGALGYLMRNSATVGEAVRVLLLHLYLHDRIGVPALLPLPPSNVLLAYSAYQFSTEATGQLYDAATAIGNSVLRELCGPSWKPHYVQLARSRPEVVSIYRRAFDAPVRFNAEVSGVVFRSSWLDRPVEGADPRLRAVLSQAVRNAGAAGPMTFAEQVQRVLHQMVLGGTASSDSVARLFAMSERTLRLQLRAQGTSVRQLLEQARFALAQQLMRDTQLPLSEIAAALRYADPPTFSRAFRNWAGMSPRQWRNALVPRTPST